jgi:Ricin-type beta-trefoil lectin domain-like
MTTWNSIFINLNSGLALDLFRGNLAMGTPMVQYNFHGEWNQRWRLGETEQGGRLAWLIFPDTGPVQDLSLFCLGVTKGSMDDGAEIHLQDRNVGREPDYQKFFLEQVAGQPEGFVRIVATHSGKCFDVEFQSQNQLAKVHQFRINGQTNQVWRIIYSLTLES